MDQAALWNDKSDSTDLIHNPITRVPVRVWAVVYDYYYLTFTGEVCSTCTTTLFYIFKVNFSSVLFALYYYSLPSFSEVLMITPLPAQQYLKMIELLV